MHTFSALHVSLPSLIPVTAGTSAVFTMRYGVAIAAPKLGADNCAYNSLLDKMQRLCNGASLEKLANMSSSAMGYMPYTLAGMTNRCYGEQPCRTVAY